MPISVCCLRCLLGLVAWPPSLSQWPSASERHHHHHHPPSRSRDLTEKPLRFKVILCGWMLRVPVSTMRMCTQHFVIMKISVYICRTKLKCNVLMGGLCKTTKWRNIPLGFPFCYICFSLQTFESILIFFFGKLHLYARFTQIHIWNFEFCYKH